MLFFILGTSHEILVLIAVYAQRTPLTAHPSRLIKISGPAKRQWSSGDGQIVAETVCMLGC